MDHELKQRLIGAIVVTALAAIFLPMLFDDPIDNSGQQVGELVLPKAPENVGQNTNKELPDNFGRALTPDQETATGDESGIENTKAEESTPPLDSTAPIDEDLTATEEETVQPDASAARHKSSSDTLDTGDVVNVEKSDNEEPVTRVHKKSVAAEHKIADATTEPKTTKKPKNTEVENHKAAEKLKSNDDSENAIPKTKETSTKTGSGLSRWSIQAGSFSKKENAIAMLEKLQKQGFPVTLQSKGDIYRLKIGPELDKQRAVDMKRKLDKQNIQSLMITE